MSLSSIFCSKCEKPVEVPDFSETPEGILLSCPECDGPVGFVKYEDLDEDDFEVVETPLATEVVEESCKCEGCPAHSDCYCEYDEDDDYDAVNVQEEEQSKPLDYSVTITFEPMELATLITGVESVLESFQNGYYIPVLTDYLIDINDKTLNKLKGAITNGN